MNQGAATQMGQRAVTGVQQAGQAAQTQLGTFQDDFQKMLATTQGQPAAPASPGTAGAVSSPAPLGPGGAGGGGRRKFSPASPGSRSIVTGGASSFNGNMGREADLYSQFANTDLTKLTSDRLSGVNGWTGALSKAQQAGQQAQQLGRGQAGISNVLGSQSGPGYYGGRGRAIDAYATANSGVDFQPASNAWKGIADAYGLADTTSAGEVDALRQGAADYALTHPAPAAEESGTPSAPAEVQPSGPPGLSHAGGGPKNTGGFGWSPFAAPALNPGGIGRAKTMPVRRRMG